MQHKIRNLILVPLTALAIGGCAQDGKEIEYAKAAGDRGREVYTVREKENGLQYTNYIDYGPDGQVDVIYRNFDDKNSDSDGTKTFVIRGGRAGYDGRFAKDDRFVTIPEVVESLQYEFEMVKQDYSKQENESRKK